VDIAKASTMAITFIALFAAGLAFSIGAATASSNLGTQSQVTAQSRVKRFIGYKRLQCQVQLL
jgi:hypothetical protein